MRHQIDLYDFFRENLSLKRDCGLQKTHTHSIDMSFFCIFLKGIRIFIDMCLKITFRFEKPKWRNQGYYIRRYGIAGLNGKCWDVKRPNCYFIL